MTRTQCHYILLSVGPIGSSTYTIFICSSRLVEDGWLVGRVGVLPTFKIDPSIVCQLSLYSIGGGMCIMHELVCASCHNTNLIVEINKCTLSHEKLINTAVEAVDMKGDG